MDELERIRVNAFRDIDAARDAGELELVRVAYVGRKGKLTEILRSLAKRTVAERKSLGSSANAFRDEFESQLAARAMALGKDGGPARERFDPTKPGAKLRQGHLHPLSIVDADVRRIFAGMNFTVLEGQEIETEYYNFDALNIPVNHPAREMHDTFWLEQPAANAKDSRKHLLLRTHISCLQARYMEAHQPPFQFIAPGRVFRYEASDATHESQFHYVEGMMVGPDISLANFKYIVERFFEEFFRGNEVAFRFQPSYFPFVEPGLEVFIQIGEGRWLEVMGAGMVHRRVFDLVKYDSDTVHGFAFGVGLDRLAMIKYGIPDIRLLYGADLRFIRQF